MEGETQVVDGILEVVVRAGLNHEVSDVAPLIDGRGIQRRTLVCLPGDDEVATFSTTRFAADSQADFRYSMMSTSPNIPACLWPETAHQKACDPVSFAVNSIVA